MTIAIDQLLQAVNCSFSTADFRRIEVTAERSALAGLHALHYPLHTVVGSAVAAWKLHQGSWHTSVGAQQLCTTISLHARFTRSPVDTLCVLASPSLPIMRVGIAHHPASIIPACGTRQRIAHSWTELHIESPVHVLALCKTSITTRSACSPQLSSSQRRCAFAHQMRAPCVPAMSRGVAASSATGSQTVMVPVANGSEEIEAVGVRHPRRCCSHA